MSRSREIVVLIELTCYQAFLKYSRQAQQIYFLYLSVFLSYPFVYFYTPVRCIPHFIYNVPNVLCLFFFFCFCRTNSSCSDSYLSFSFLSWKIFRKIKVFIIFQVVDLWDDFTPSLLHFPLGIRKPGGNSHMKRQGMFVGKFEFDSYGRLMWTMPGRHYTPKRYHLKQNRLDYQLLFKRGDPTRVIERSTKIKSENLN